MDIDMSPLMRHCFDATASRLSREFRGVYSPKTAARYVAESYEQVCDRPRVRPSCLPVIIDRVARERLWAALAHHASSGWVAVRSAGSDPEEQIDPVVADPAAQLEDVRLIRYELHHRVWDLIETLVPRSNLIAIERPIGGGR